MSFGQLLSSTFWSSVADQTIFLESFWISTLKSAAPQLVALIAGIPVGLWLHLRQVRRQHNAIFRSTKILFIEELNQNVVALLKYQSEVKQSQMPISLQCSTTGLTSLLQRPELLEFLSPIQLKSLFAYADAARTAVDLEQFWRTGLALHLAGSEKSAFGEIKLLGATMIPAVETLLAKAQVLSHDLA